MAKINVRTRYATTPHTLLISRDVSLGAKGLYAFLQDKPDGWDFSIAGIASQLKEGREAVLHATRDLERSGYLHRDKTRDAQGRWDVIYTLYDTPFTVDGFPVTDNTVTDNSVTVSIISNTDLSNTDKHTCVSLEDFSFFCKKNKNKTLIFEQLFSVFWLLYAKKE
jgi:hypothetical protein